MLDYSALRHFNPLFVTPCYSGQVTSGYATSMLALTNELWRLGVRGSMRICAGESLVTRAQ